MAIWKDGEIIQEQIEFPGTAATKTITQHLLPATKNNWNAENL